MNADSDEAADAVLIVDDAGTLTLFFGAGSAPHAEAMTNSAAIRSLLEYAEHLDRPITVATHYPSGHRTLHRFDPDGTVTMVEIAMARQASGQQPGRDGPGRRRTRPASLVGMAALLLVTLTLTGADRASMPFAGPGDPDETFGSDVLTGRTEYFRPYTDDDAADRQLQGQRASSAQRPAWMDTGAASDDPSGGSTDLPDSGPGGQPDGHPGNWPEDGAGDQPDGSPTSPPDGSPTDPPGGGPTDPPTGPPDDGDPTTPPDDGDPTGPPDDEDPTTPPDDDDPGDDDGQDPPEQDGDSEPPTRPGWVSVSGRTGTSLSVSWGTATDNVGVTGYAVYIDGSWAQTAGGTSATISGLDPATSYDVSVAAVDAAGNTSARTSVRGTTLDTVPPAAPTGLSGRAGLLSVDLSWDTAVDNVGVTSYAVYVDGERAQTVTSTETTVNGLLGGVLHTFSVAAIDGAGNLSPRVNVELKAKLL